MSNAEYIERARIAEGTAKKARGYAATHGEEPAKFFLKAYEYVAGPLQKGAKVLDFGCGVGHLVHAFLGRGFDAYGVDILEFWGKDVDLYGAESWDVPANVLPRLRVSGDTVPLSDGEFDLVVSDQVLEHVFDLSTVFSEITRVLKPGGIAIHRFPKPTGLVEAHTKLPLVQMHRFQWYLAMWALLGKRHQRQHGMGWREAAKSYRDIFATTHYVSNRDVLRLAPAGTSAWFADYLLFSEGRAASLHRRMSSAGFAWLSRPILSAVALGQVLVMQKH